MNLFYQSPNTIISVDRYRSLELAARRAQSNRILQLVNPVVFNKLGFPTEIESELEIWKYADTMQEGRFNETVDYCLFGGITDEEWELTEEIAINAIGLIRDLTGKEMIPWDSLMRSLLIFRHIKFVTGGSKKVIFEIGSGSGYLGCYLGLAGHRHISAEIVQGFYLYQSRLYAQLFKEKFYEAALPVSGQTLSSALADHQICHLPWWLYLAADDAIEALSFDIATANHMLCEMSPLSLAHLFSFLDRSGKLSGKKPVFIFENWGYDLASSPRWYVNSRFYKYQFRLCHNDGLTTAFSPADCDMSQGSALYPKIEMQNCYDVDSIRSLEKKNYESLWFPERFHNLNNPVSACIIKSREAIKPLITIDRETLIRRLSALAPQASHPENGGDYQAMRISGMV